MKLQEMLDVLQKRHPLTSQNQITRLINRAMQDFCTRTEVHEEEFTGSLTIDQRWYDIPDRAIKILHVVVDDETAPMVVGPPNKKDTT